MFKYKKVSALAAIGLGLTITLAACTSDYTNKTDQKSEVSTADKNQSNSKSESTSAKNGTSNPNHSTNTQTNTGKTNTQSSKTTESSKNPVTPAQNVDMSSVTAVRLADPQTGWTGGNGWIAKTTNGGKTWAVHYQGTGTVQQIFALNHRNVWATLNQGGNSLRLLQSDDGGLSWTLIGTTPNNTYLHFVSNTTALSGNAYSLDGGKTWHQIKTPKNVVGQVYFHDLKNGWAITQNGNILNVQKTADGGETWKIVLTKKLASPLVDATIRSAGTKDAWIECIGDSGMTQTSYSVFHTIDGGKSWRTVLANSTAGGGPAPGVDQNNDHAAHNKGAKPGPFYVVSPEIAYMGGSCQACDKPNSIGWTVDGGKTWVNSLVTLKGYGDAYLAVADAKHVWWITTENRKPSIMYTTSDGGTHWTQVHTFK